MFFAPESAEVKTKVSEFFASNDKKLGHAADSARSRRLNALKEKIILCVINCLSISNFYWV